MTRIECARGFCHETAVLRGDDGAPVCASHRTPDMLTVDAPTDDTYRTRCPDCDRPVHWLSVFPAGRCLDCHGHATRHDPMPTARELAVMWGARP